MRSLLFICFLSAVLCACSNNCNGHGKCNNGVCECFGSTGLETVKDGSGTDVNVDSNYGPDCSRKMCPMGITFGAIGKTGYSVNLDKTPAPVPDRRRIDDQLVQGGTNQPTATNAAGSVVQDHHVYAECSGAGICNSATGVCECYDGFEGKACQRMSCPNQCSGKGKCVPISEAVGLKTNDIDKLFGFNGRVDGNDNDAEAKFFGCLCDKGFRGPDCSLRECPSGEDPEKATNLYDNGSGDSKTPNLKVEQRDCSGRGNCNYETGECACFNGFSGASCSTMSAYM